jgi:hypothetical protein
MEAQLIESRPLDRNSKRCDKLNKRLQVADPWNVAQHDGGVRQQRGAHNGKGRVLVTGRAYRTGQRVTTFDYELLRWHLVSLAGGALT